MKIKDLNHLQKIEAKTDLVEGGTTLSWEFPDDDFDPNNPFPYIPKQDDCPIDPLKNPQAPWRPGRW